MKKVTKFKLGSEYYLMLWGMLYKATYTEGAFVFDGGNQMILSEVKRLDGEVFTISTEPAEILPHYNLN